MSVKSLLSIAVALFAATASGLCQEKKDPEKDDGSYERIELKGRLKVEKCDDRFDLVKIPIRATVNGWLLDLTDANGHPIASKIEAAKRLDGKIVVVTGKPSVNLTLPRNGLGQGTIWKEVTSAEIKEAAAK